MTVLPSGDAALVREMVGFSFARGAVADTAILRKELAR
jgi:hypothetical protein